MRHLWNKFRNESGDIITEYFDQLKTKNPTDHRTASSVLMSDIT